ncbi:hypothetical protein [Nocardiopsis halophila]|uniref:hypothetical protein n=1 Tax=Nocardiopsis halophila TaxID=141692 RepID=UPI000347F005|nr:hypothetical protein [Nocardiopsis halophila]
MSPHLRIHAHEVHKDDLIQTLGGWRKVLTDPTTRPAQAHTRSEITSIKVEAPPGHHTSYLTLGYLADSRVEVLRGEGR